ncbi:MAG: hypothetical protein SXA11_11715 [Cyanobacteriota bacterium]|nr:hypothetical protein [Cyanobacteriota bacterium]
METEETGDRAPQGLRNPVFGQKPGFWPWTENRVFFRLQLGFALYCPGTADMGLSGIFEGERLLSYIH